MDFINTKWIVINAVLFPIVFPDELAERFSNTRSEPISVFHLFAFAATVILFTILVNKFSGYKHPIINSAVGATIF